MTRPAVLAVVGGGVSVAGLFEAIAARGDLPATEVRLHARRHERTAVIARHAQAVLDAGGRGWSVEAVGDLGDAVDGAQVVVLMVRIGGWRARSHDEEFPRRHGLVGDEGLGAGGVANAWRTVPPVERIAQVIASRAPDAVVWNLVAPLGISTRALLDAGLHAVGVCELPTVTNGRLLAETPDGTIPGLSYAGLNHAGWFWTDDPAGRTLLADAGTAAGLVTVDTWAEFGAVPLPYHYRVFDPAGGERLGIRQPVGRAQQLATLAERALADMAERPGTRPSRPGRPTPWFDRALVPMLAAWLGGPPHRGTLDVANGGLLPGLPGEVVVEVDAVLRGAEVELRPPAAEPPPAVAGLLTRLATVEGLAYRAAVERSDRGVRDALASLPYELAGGRPEVELDALVVAATTDVVGDPAGAVP